MYQPSSPSLQDRANGTVGARTAGRQPAVPARDTSGNGPPSPNWRAGARRHLAAIAIHAHQRRLRRRLVLRGWRQGQAMRCETLTCPHDSDFRFWIFDFGLGRMKSKIQNRKSQNPKGKPPQVRGEETCGGPLGDLIMARSEEHTSE